MTQSNTTAKPAAADGKPSRLEAPITLSAEQLEAVAGGLLPSLAAFGPGRIGPINGGPPQLYSVPALINVSTAQQFSF